MAQLHSSNNIVGPISEGNIKTVPLPRVLHSLSMGQMTGILTFTFGGIEKKVYFSHGMIVFATSNVQSEFLGDILRDRKVITQEQLDKAREIYEDRDGLMRIGEILVEMNIIDEKNLVGYVRMQVSNNLYSLFDTDDAMFFFNEEDFPQESIQINLTVGDLIVTGIRGMKQREILERWLPDKNLYLRQSNDPYIRFQKIRLSADEKKIYQSITGEQTIEDVLKIQNFQKMDVLAGLCGLIYSGLLELDETSQNDLDLQSVLGSELEEIIAYDLSSFDFDEEIPDEYGYEERGTAELMDLRYVFFPSYFMKIHREGLTGLLNCKRENINKVIYFQEGDPIYARSDAPFEQLIPLLKFAGRLSEKQAETAYNVWIGRENEWQGTILMELGFLDFDDLEWPFQFQIKEIIAEMLAWEEGTVSFTEGELPESPFVVAELSVSEVVLDTIKRNAQKPGVLRYLPNLRSILGRNKLDAHVMNSLPLTAQEYEVLNLIDGKRSIEVIQDMVNLEPHYVLALCLIFDVLEITRVTGYSEEQVIAVEILPEVKKEPEPVLAAKPEPPMEVRTVEERQAMSKKDVELAGKIHTFHKKIADIDDPILILGIQENSTIELLEFRFRVLINEFHPDQTVHIGDSELVEKAQQIIEKVTHAYENVKNTLQKIKQQFQSDDGFVFDIPEQDGSSIAEADQLFQRGNLSGAYQLYHKSFKETDSRPVLLARMAFIMAFRDKKFRDAKKLCRHAIEKNPENATLHALMGAICASSGLSVVAKQAMNQSRSLEPKNSFALCVQDVFKTSTKNFTNEQMNLLATRLLENL